MSKNIDREKQISLLQQNLSSIRKIAGWTSEELGDKIGVTKQTISNLENNKTPMNFTQYIAIRAVLDCEIEENKDNELLPKVIDVLLEHGDKMEEENYKKVQEGIAAVAVATSSGITKATLMSMFTSLVLPSLSTMGLSLINPIGAIVGTATWVVGSKWLKSLLKSKCKNKEVSK